jgi:hypothetical protein
MRVPEVKYKYSCSYTAPYIQIYFGKYIRYFKYGRSNTFESI